MAYDIRYYTNRGMTHLAESADRVGSLDRYPAPRGAETAYAVHVQNPELNRYGYDGAWHVQPPPEAESDEYPIDARAVKR